MLRYTLKCGSAHGPRQLSHASREETFVTENLIGNESFPIAGDC